MHEEHVVVRRRQGLEAGQDFLVVGGREGPHDDGHGPNHVGAHMRPTNAFRCAALRKLSCDTRKQHCTLKNQGLLGDSRRARVLR